MDNTLHSIIENIHYVQANSVRWLDLRENNVLKFFVNTNVLITYRDDLYISLRENLVDVDRVMEGNAANIDKKLLMSNTLTSILYFKKGPKGEKTITPLSLNLVEILWKHALIRKTYEIYGLIRTDGEALQLIVKVRAELERIIENLNSEIQKYIDFFEKADTLLNNKQQEIAYNG